jgi:arylamine N-acetyltransferase
VGDYRQGPFHLALDETAGATPVGDWHLTHDPAGGFTGMSWRAAEATIGDFTERHVWLSTSPDSGFVRTTTAQRRDATGVDIVRGLVLTRVGDRASTTELIERDDWFAALADVFDLRFDFVAPDALDHLWETSLAKHQAWDAAGRP